MLTAVPLQKAALTAVGLAAALTLTGCGSDPDGSTAPTEASKGEFCEVVSSLDPSDADRVVDDLLETGTPAGIPGDARAGFEVMIEKATEDSISDADQEKVAAFLAYVTDTCAGALG